MLACFLIVASVFVATESEVVWPRDEDIANNASVPDNQSLIRQPIKLVTDSMKPCLDHPTPYKCLAKSTLHSLEKLDEGAVCIFGESVVLVRDPGVPRPEESRALLPAISDFFSSRSLLLRFPTEYNQGRKKKGNGMYWAMGSMIAGMMLAGKLATLAAMAGKALAASMAALLLAALSNRGGHGHHSSASPSSHYEVRPYEVGFRREDQVISVPAGGSSHHMRSYLIGQAMSGADNTYVRDTRDGPQYTEYAAQ